MACPGDKPKHQVVCPEVELGHCLRTELTALVRGEYGQTGGIPNSTVAA